MADVYLVVDPSDPDATPRVVKRILPHLAQDETFIRMFLQEARIALAIAHPNVVRIHRLDEDQGLPYLLMDHVDGVTFRQIARAAEAAGGPVPAGIALDLVMQACTGAHAVHETIVGEHAEIVHRDLCPHNLMVDGTGHVVLLDFGIAKAAQGMDTTRTGVLKGKTTYLAPEQVRGGAIDRRTDLWALSIVLWELLAGRRAFDGEAEFDTMQRIVRGDVPRLDTVRPDLPSALVETVHRCLSADRNDRFPDAIALREALSRAAARADLPIDRAATAAFVTRVLHGAPPGIEPAATPGPRTETPRTERPSTAAVAGRAAAWTVGFGIAAVAVFAVGAGAAVWFLTPTGPTGAPVRITFAPILPAAEMAAELEPLRADLEAALDRPVLVQIAPTYAATGALLQAGRTEFAVLPPRLFLEAERALDGGLRPLAIVEADRAAGTEGLLLAREDVAWTGPESLRGRTLCLADPASATGYALPMAYLAEHGIDPAADLAGTVRSADHHELIRDVATGRCDVGATYAGAVRSAADTDVPVHQTRQVAVTGHTPNDAVCAGPSTDPALTEAVRVALLAWDPEVTRGARTIGVRQRISGFVPFDPAAHDALRRALDPALSGGGAGEPSP